MGEGGKRTLRSNVSILCVCVDAVCLFGDINISDGAKTSSRDSETKRSFGVARIAWLVISGGKGSFWFLVRIFQFGSSVQLYVLCFSENLLDIKSMCGYYAIGYVFLAIHNFVLLNRFDYKLTWCFATLMVNFAAIKILFIQSNFI